MDVWKGFCSTLMSPCSPEVRSEILADTISYEDTTNPLDLCAHLTVGFEDAPECSLHRKSVETILKSCQSHATGNSRYHILQELNIESSEFNMELLTWSDTEYYFDGEPTCVMLFLLKFLFDESAIFI